MFVMQYEQLLVIGSSTQLLTHFSKLLFLPPTSVVLADISTQYYKHYYNDSTFDVPYMIKVDTPDIYTKMHIYP